MCVLLLDITNLSCLASLVIWVPHLPVNNVQRYHVIIQLLINTHVLVLYEEDRAYKHSLTTCTQLFLS